MNMCNTCTYHKNSKHAKMVAFTDNGVLVSAFVGAPITDPVTFTIYEEQEQTNYGQCVTHHPTYSFYSILKLFCAIFRNVKTVPSSNNVFSELFFCTPFSDGFSGMISILSKSLFAVFY